MDEKPVEVDDSEEPITEGERLAALLPVDPLEIEVGYEIVPLVDISQGGELTDRIGGLRRNLVSELGMILPPIHVRDNLQLSPRQYRILMSGAEIASGEVRPNMMLAIDPSGGAGPIKGERTKEPAFGLPPGGSPRRIGARPRTWATRWWIRRRSWSPTSPSSFGRTRRSFSDAARLRTSSTSWRALIPGSWRSSSRRS